MDTPVAHKTALEQSFSPFLEYGGREEEMLFSFGKPRIYDDIAEKSIAALLSDATGKFVSD